MVCFVMALKARAVSGDWNVVCRLLERTLGSIWNQTDPDFRVWVVCHDAPTWEHTFDERLEIISVDWPLPDLNVTGEGMKDKWRKVAVGLVRARDFDPDFVMTMDADDLVSRRLVEHAHAHRDSNGWIIERGYDYFEGANSLLTRHHFYGACGTSALVNARRIALPSTPEKRDECLLLTHGHTVIARALAEVGMPLEPLPFPGAVYVRAHGDNDSQTGINQAIIHSRTPKFLRGGGNWIRSLPRRRPLTPALRREFLICEL